MATLNLFFIILVSSMFLISSAVKLSVREQQLSRIRTQAFVESQCQDTHYPKLCVHCLSTYVNSTTQSPQQIAHIALKVSLVKARYTRSYLIKVAKELKQIKAKDYQATKDCLDQINDAVEQLTRSVTELQHIKEEDENDFVWRQSNVLTWCSAALTDALTCVDGFSSGYSKGGKTRAILKAKVINVAQVTSNALAFFDRYVARHRVSHATKP